MDTKQIEDKLAILQGDMHNISDLHGSDFMYFSTWLQDLDKKVRGFEATILKLEKTNQFADMLKSSAQAPARGVSTRNLVITAGVVFVAGVYTGRKLSKSKKGDANA